MKRIFAACFALLMLAAFAACGTKPEPSPAPLPDAVPTEAPEAKPEKPVETEAPTAEPETQESKIDLPDGVYTRRVPLLVSMAKDLTR